MIWHGEKIEGDVEIVLYCIVMLAQRCKDILHRHTTTNEVVKCAVHYKVQIPFQ